MASLQTKFISVKFERESKTKVVRGPCPPCGKKSQESKSFVLRTYIVGGVGVKKAHTDWWCGASFPRET